MCFMKPLFVSLKTCIVSHECNGIDIITALILNDISPLCRYRMELVLQLKVKMMQTQSLL